MKKLALFTLIVLSNFAVYAQNISLPNPQKDGGKSVLKTINDRKSDRNFRPGDISMQDLSTILYAGFGFSHDGRRTAPSAMNAQDIELFVFLESGIYRWDAEKNILVLIRKGDYRPKTDRPDSFAGKVTNIAIVSNFEKFARIESHHTQNIFGAMSSAYVSENMYLAVEGLDNGLGSVTRYGAFAEKEISPLMKLNEKEHLFLFQTIGMVNE